MTMTLLFAPFLLAVEAAPAAEPPAAGAPVTLEELSLEQAAALRCAVGFALVSAWQTDGDERGADFPAVGEEGAREFFVRTMARLMDERALDRAGVLDLVALQQERFAARPATLEEIMPACLLMQRAAGL
ncbi:hypothetical protein [Erythrobacter sp. HL-111]|uniref:hypothetical protein n=1 Tax=Erythrobacter sp. HL-111 TaxID=1798193 RepID=UPI0006DA32FC|nr:hypothetical protein [Erythrobacter sp. HL-111]KPP87381.1 MAG: hypothetical protein HLUCCO15_12405 [Erythrobacteraceae bacterium HL-111]SDS97183.1 hypothetical protein SAMN04515621_2628 [Erythrobacter sp. HL-111]